MTSECEYEDLYGRHKRRSLRGVAAYMAVVVLSVAAFAGSIVGAFALFAIIGNSVDDDRGEADTIDPQSCEARYDSCERSSDEEIRELNEAVNELDG